MKVLLSFDKEVVAHVFYSQLAHPGARTPPERVFPRFHPLHRYIVKPQGLAGARSQVDPTRGFRKSLRLNNVTV
jgi:hypothetical protein